MKDRWFLDTEPNPEFPIYTRANAGEVMPEPVSPMTHTIGMMVAGDLGWRAAYVSTGCFDDEEFTGPPPYTLGCFGGYFFLNMSQTRVFGARTPGMTPELVDLQYFGEMPGIPPYRPRPNDDDPRYAERMQRWLESIFAKEDLPEVLDDQRAVGELVAGRPDLAAASDEELVARARAMVEWYRRLFERHIVVSTASGVGIGTVAGVCQAIGRPELTMPLVSGVGDVDSAAPSWVLWELSRQVAGSAELTAAFDQGVDGLLDRLRASASGEAHAFLRSFSDFSTRFEARGPNEWELRSNTWGTRPEIALAALDRMRLAPETAAPQGHTEERRSEREQATAAVTEALSGNDEALAQFLGGLRVALVNLPGRERTKTNNIRVVHEQRMALRELGRRMAEAGHLDSVESVFLLTDGELDAFVADPASFADVVREREADYSSLFALEPPFIVHETVPPLSQWRRRDEASAERAETGTVLSGIPGCPGQATGRARVVLDPSDPAALEPGDVLVAPVTDPAWTPLFVPASAVVVDVGAQITHAVIVSRELGIPCVVSVTDATLKIPDGALVTVDGTAGTVTLA